MTAKAFTATQRDPFADANVTTLMQTIRTDPEEAKRQIAAAGFTPADFGWSGEPVPVDGKGNPK